jgi:hypothetical protein
MFFDPVARDLMKVSPAITWMGVRDWLSRRSPAQLDVFLAAAAQWQREVDAVAGADLALVHVPLPSAPAGVLLDRRRGVWLFAMGYSPNRLERLFERAQSWLALAGFAPEHLDYDPAFGVRALVAFQGAAVYKGAHAAGDLKEFVQPKALRSARPADLALSVAAHHVLRAFAWRLPGFAASSQPYLFANLLDFPGVLDDDAERRVVRLGQPPLQYVLGLTGMARSPYRMSWLDERPFVLFQERR